MRGLSETEAEDSWAADVVSQLFPAFLMFILGVETSAIAGEWAQQLNVPGTGFARYAFLLIPAAAFLPAVLPRRISRRDLYSDALMLGLMLFPVALFNLGTRSLTVPGASSGVPAREFRAELGFPIVMESDSNGLHIYFRRDHEDKLVREALGRHQMANGKWKIENGK